MSHFSSKSGMGNAVCEARSESKVLQTLRRIWGSWATRSLAVGALATALDLAIGLSLRHWFQVDTRPSAMIGVIVGGTFNYFANRWFAFRERGPQVASSLIKFVVVTALSSLVHGQVVVWLTDRLEVPFAISKVLADLAIFTFGQLLVLRYIVFPKSKRPSVVKIMHPTATPKIS